MVDQKNVRLNKNVKNTVVIDLEAAKDNEIIQEIADYFKSLVYGSNEEED